MKINKVIVLSFIVLGLSYCKTKKESEKTVSAAPLVEVSDALKASAEARYPGIAIADIAEGQKLYTGKCGKCHGLPKVDDRTEAKWPGTIKWMAPKANIDEAQELQILKYVLSARDIVVKK